MACAASVFALNAPKPPSTLGGLAVSAYVFVNTPVLCGNLPVKIDEREDQQRELLTK